MALRLPRRPSQLFPSLDSISSRNSPSDSRRRRANRRSRAHRKSRIETLERRQLLAGDLELVRIAPHSEIYEGGSHTCGYIESQGVSDPNCASPPGNEFSDMLFEARYTPDPSMGSFSFVAFTFSLSGSGGDTTGYGLDSFASFQTAGTLPDGTLTLSISDFQSGNRDDDPDIEYWAQVYVVAAADADCDDETVQLSVESAALYNGGQNIETLNEGPETITIHDDHDPIGVTMAPADGTSTTLNEEHGFYFTPVPFSDVAEIDIEFDRPWDSDELLELTVSAGSTDGYSVFVIGAESYSTTVDNGIATLSIEVFDNSEGLSLRVISKVDAEEGDTDLVTIAIVEPDDPCPEYEGNDSVTVTINDIVESLDFEVDPTEVAEYQVEDTRTPGVIEDPFPVLTIKPAADEVLMNGTGMFELDISASNSATLGSDYTFVNLTTGQPIQFTPVADDETKLRSQPISLSGLPSFELKVVPINDTVVEKEEIIDVKLLAIPAYNPQDEYSFDTQYDTIGSGTVTITELYFGTEKESDGGNSCGCPCTCPGVPSYGLSRNQARVTDLTGFTQQHSNDGINEKPLLLIELPLPAGKAVPTSVNVRVDFVTPDGSSLGREVVGSVYSFTLTPNQNNDVSESVDRVLMFTIQPDLGHLIPAWQEPTSEDTFQSTGQNQGIVHLEITAHATFPGEVPPVTDERFSGWIGRHSHLFVNRSAGGLADGHAPGLNPLGLSRAIPDAQRVDPDESGGAGGSGALAASPVSAASSGGGSSSNILDFVTDNTAEAYDGTAKVTNGFALFRPDGSTAFFESGSSTSPQTPSTLSGLTLTHIDGSQDIFSANGNQIARRDPQGNTTTFAYDSHGRVVSATDPLGRVTTISYFKDGLVSPTAEADTVVFADPFGQSSSYVFLNGVLTITHTDPDGPGPRAALQEYWGYSGANVASIVHRNADTQEILRSYNFSYDSQTERLVSMSGGGLPTTSILKAAGYTYVIGPGTTSGNGPTVFPPTHSKFHDVDSEEREAYWLYNRETIVRQSVDGHYRTSMYHIAPGGHVVSMIDPIQFDRLEATPGFSFFGDQSESASRIFGAEAYHYEVDVPRRDRFGQLDARYLGRVHSITTVDPDLGVAEAIVPTSPQTTAFDRDTDGRTTSVTYPGLPTQPIAYAPGFTVPTFAADELGNHLDQTVNGAGLVTSQTYVQQASGGVPAKNLSHTSITYETSGLPQGFVDTITQHSVAGEDIVTDYDYWTTSTAASPAVAGQVRSITIAPGTDDESVTSFAYDARGNLTSVTDPVGRITTMAYDNANRLIHQTGIDPDGPTGPMIAPVFRYEYDPLGNVTAVETIASRLDASGSPVVTSEIKFYEYDQANRLTAVNEHEGDTVIYLFVDGAGELQRTDDAAVAAAATPNAAQVAAHANQNNVIQRGPTLPFFVGERYVQLDYSQAGELLSVTDWSDSESVNRVTSYSYDQLGRMVQSVSSTLETGRYPTNDDQTQTSAFGDLRYVSQYDYDNLGNLVQQVDSLGRKTSMGYDDLNRLVELRRPDPTSIGQTGPTDTWTYTPGPVGWTVAATDSEGRVVNQVIDSLGRTIQQFGDIAATNLEFDTTGLMTSATRSGLVTDYLYDAAGRVQSILSPITGGDPRATTTYAYFDDHQIESITDPLGRTTTYGYNPVGWVDTITRPDPDASGPQLPNTTTYAYDSLGKVLTSTDATGDVTTYRYDALERLAATVDPRGGVTSQTYNRFGELESVTDAVGNRTEYDYNRAGLLVTERQVNSQGFNPDRSYTYDGNGNLRTRTDRNGETIEYQYDGLDRITGELWDGTLVYQYGHDSTNLLVSVDDLTSTDSDLAFAYDARQRLAAETASLGSAGSYGLDYTHELTDDLQSVALVLGGTLAGTAIAGGFTDRTNTYQYDGRRRLTGVTQQARGESKFVSLGYDAASQLTDIRRFNAGSADPNQLAIHTRNRFDGAGRITSITHSDTELTTTAAYGGGTTAPAGTLAAYAFGYDVSDRMTSMASFADGFETEFAYNANDELISQYSAPLAPAANVPDLVMPSEGLFATDLSGNRLDDEGNSSSDAGSHNRLSADVGGYQYDAEGRLISKSSAKDFHLGDFGRGIAVADNATGVAFILYSPQNVHDRFTSSPVNINNAEHFVAVRYLSSSGIWQYNDNQSAGRGWRAFTPIPGDRLLASVNFNLNTIDPFTGAEPSVYVGIDTGYGGGDLEFLPETFDGVPNAGEIGITGSTLSDTADIGPTRAGVAIANNYGGAGYVMYSVESVHDRFAGPNAPHAENSDHLIAVRYRPQTATWQYNDNRTAGAGWRAFTPTRGDRLVAFFNFATGDSFTYRGYTDNPINGVRVGYDIGDLEITLDRWRGDDFGKNLTVTGKTFATRTGTTTYDWDHRGRLTSVDTIGFGGETVSDLDYRYDALDRRIGRTHSGHDGVITDEVFLYQGEHVAAVAQDNDLDGNYTISDRFLHGMVTDQVLAMDRYTDDTGPSLTTPTATTGAGESFWTLADHQGSIRDVVDQAGIVRQHVIYDAFGNRVDEVHRDATGAEISSADADAVDSLFGYAGREWDEAADLQYNRARWYDPATGRWLSQDPIGFAAGDANLYRYVGNGPTTKIDPSGLEEWRLDLYDHGGPHFQLGNSRWDAVTLEPIRHLGDTPRPLTVRQLEELRRCGLWDRAVNNVEKTAIESALRKKLSAEVLKEAKARGLRTLKKKVAREIARQIIGKTPLVLAFIVLDSREALAACQERGPAYALANNLLPVELIDNAAADASESYTDWRREQRRSIWERRLLNGGLSPEEF